MMGRRIRSGAATWFAVLLLLLVAGIGLSAWHMPRAKAADTTKNYDSCPAFSTFQLDVAGVASGETGVFTFKAGLNCDYSPTSPLGSGTLTIQAGAAVTINGNGLKLATGTGSTIEEAGPDVIVTGNGASLTVDRTTVEFGSHGILAKGPLTVTDSYITGNRLSGIVAPASTTILRTTSSRNGEDGILIASHISTSGSPSPTITVVVTNSTLSNNQFNGIEVGGDPVHLFVTSSTIVDNGVPPQINNTHGILFYPTHPEISSVRISASILSNVATNCDDSRTGDPFIDGGHNLFGSTDGSDNSCQISTDTSSSRIVKASDLKLLPLGFYGGLTPTNALGDGSFALDTIPISTKATIDGEPITICPGPTDRPFTDQRGVARPQLLECDAGAFEATRGPQTVTTSRTDCPTPEELQGDFNLAASIAPGTLTIKVGKANCVVDLSKSLSTDAASKVILDGNGLTITGGSESQHSSFHLIDLGDGASFTLDHTTLADGNNAINSRQGSVSVTLTDSTLRDNNYGFNSRAATTTITVINSSISDNDTTGIRSFASGGTVTVTVVNSTISDNGKHGISTYINFGNKAGTGTVTVTDSTISGNAEDGIQDPTTITLTATILANNGGRNCANFVTVNDGGYNLAGSDSGTDNHCQFSGSTKGSKNVKNSVLNLLPLGNYGGPTATIALGLGSAAIDQIPSGVCSGYSYPDGTPITTDQRGVNRPQPGDGNCDAGAFEAPAVAVSLTPSTGPDATTGWYNASVLGGQGKTLVINASFSGLAPGQQASCDGATVTNLPATAAILNQTAAGTASLGDGTYSITCGVRQGASILGFSYSGPAQPLVLTIDTTNPTALISSPASAAYLVGQSVTADFSCDDTGSGLADTNSCAGTLDTTSIASGTSLDTSAGAVGSHTLSVTATDAAGNTNSQLVTFEVEALTAPTLKVNDGTAYTTSGFWYNLSNSPNGVTMSVSDTNSLTTGYSCTDNGSSLSLTLSTDTPPIGTAALDEGVHHLSCAATATSTDTPSAATTATIQIDLTRPLISTPVANQHYLLDAPVALNCVDPKGAHEVTGSGIASCQVTVTLPDTTTQTVSMPGDVPTHQIGSYTITVKDVADNAGNTSSQTVIYEVRALTAPTLEVNGGTAYTNASFWYNLSNSPTGVTLAVSDSDSAVTGYNCSANGVALTLSLSNATPPVGTVMLGEGVHDLSCTSSSTVTSTPSAATTATVQIDLTRPVVINPIANHQYVLNALVSLNCVDPKGADSAIGSGIAACQVTVTLPDQTTQMVAGPDDVPTSELGGYTVRVTNVTDDAGNAAAMTSFSYTVGYQLTALSGNTDTVRQGYYAIIRFAPMDADGQDIAKRSLKVTSVELDGPAGPNSQVIPFAHAFQFGRFGGQPGYQLTINTRNLARGEWTLQVRIGDEPMLYPVTFTVR